MNLIKNALRSRPAAVRFNDYPDAFIPELWANESIAILIENMVMGNLVYRDFSMQVASFGDTVNTRKPGEFKAKRKSAADSVTVQDNTATNVPVVLNQHLHTSFIIKDADQSKSFKDLVVEYLSPAMLSIAREVDLILGNQVYQFIGNGAGHLSGLDSNNAEDYMLDTREVLNTNKAYERGRSLVLTTKSETQLLKNSAFTAANQVGDDGTALREASLGRKFGFDIFMAQNQPYVASGASTTAGAINMAGGAAAGATSLTVDSFSAAIANGTWLTVAGDDTPLRVTGTTGGATPTAITVDRGLTTAVADNAVVTLYDPGAVNNTGGYAIGYDKEITVSGFSAAPKVGQLVTFGTAAGSAVYGIIDVNGTTGITLDRPLEAALSDSDAVNIGPPGNYNFAFHRNAIAMVSRPLALPMPGTGARAGSANYENITMRVVITYDGNKQGHLVTCDLLMGVKVLDAKLGAVMYG